MFRRLSCGNQGGNCGGRPTRRKAASAWRPSRRARCRWSTAVPTMVLMAGNTANEPTWTERLDGHLLEPHPQRPHRRRSVSTCRWSPTARSRRPDSPALRCGAGHPGRARPAVLLDGEPPHPAVGRAADITGLQTVTATAADRPRAAGARRGVPAAQGVTWVSGIPLAGRALAGNMAVTRRVPTATATDVASAGHPDRRRVT